MSTKTQTPIKILLADDDTDDCIFFQNALDELSLATELTVVRDGEQLLTHLSETAELPDVLFLDISMPRKNGIECLSAIKSDVKLKNLSVVIFTISFPHNKDFEMEMMSMLSNMGAHHYITKYRDPAQLKKVIFDALCVVTETKSLNEKGQKKTQFKTN